MSYFFLADTCACVCLAQTNRAVLHLENLLGNALYAESPLLSAFLCSTKLIIA
jgi:hypothetical protein